MRPAERAARESDWWRAARAEGARARIDARLIAVARRSARCYHRLTKRRCRGARILELGAGDGARVRQLAAAGASVTGIDISGDFAGAPAGAPGCRFAVMNAERLAFADASFDAVVGTGILHHVDWRTAIAEVCRVLRPGGRAVFREPLGHNAALRTWRRLTPGLRTADETPLSRDDVTAICGCFATARVRQFEFLTLALGALPARYLRRPTGRKLLCLAERCDRYLLRLPGIGWQARTVILALRGPMESKRSTP